jgi:hypothetical protein
MRDEQLSDEQYRACTEEYSRVMTEFRDSFRRGKLDDELFERAQDLMARICAYLEAMRRK